jgi:hypothetical protein
MQAALSREEKGRMIAEQLNAIVQQGERFYLVASQNGHGMYNVSMKENGSWICDCPDFTYRGPYYERKEQLGHKVVSSPILRCKHIIACQIRAEMREKVRENVVIEPLNPNVCPYCSATSLVRHGLRHNRYGDLQRFTCKTCGKRFTQSKFRNATLLHR